MLDALLRRLQIRMALFVHYYNVYKQLPRTQILLRPQALANKSLAIRLSHSNQQNGAVSGDR